MTLPYSTQPSSSVSGAFPPRPRPFDMTDPFHEHGIWSFWLTADLPVLQFVANLNCVLNVSYMPPPFAARPQGGRVMVRINPRYEHQEAWLWIYEQLELESRQVELSDTWEVALENACSLGNDDDNLDD